MAVSGGIIGPTMRKWIPLLALIALLAACAPVADDLITITLIADGEKRSFDTSAVTVRDVLSETATTIGEYDRVTPVEHTLVENGMTIRVTRVEIQIEKVRQDIPFERRTVRDASVPEGQTRLLEPGVTGIEELTYRVTFEDSVQVSRQLIQEVTTLEPRTEVILIGARAEIKPVPITGTVAYIADRNAWVMIENSADRHRRTFSGDLDGRVFAASPGGTHLLFTRSTTETGASAPINTLWLIEAATSEAEPIRLMAENVLWAEWEPGCTVKETGTGCRIGYSTGSTAEGSPGWKANNDLWIARPRPVDGRLLAGREIVGPNAGGAYGWWGTVYAWSPDGQHIAYARADEVGVVTTYNGSQTALAQFAPYRTYGPWTWIPTVSWSPEGDFILTTLHGPAPTGESPEDSPVFDVWVLAASGSLTAEISSEAGMWANPTYAPDGNLIVLGRARSPYSSQTSTYDVNLMDRDGSDRIVVFPQPDEVGLSYSYIAWGPEGDRFITIYQGNLYLINTANGNIQQLTTEGNITAVRWNW